MRIPPYMITCHKCGAKVDANSKAGGGWTLAPKIECSTCNGNATHPFLEIPANEKGKVIRIPLRRRNDEF